MGFPHLAIGDVLHFRNEMKEAQQTETSLREIIRELKHNHDTNSSGSLEDRLHGLVSRVCKSKCDSCVHIDLIPISTFDPFPLGNAEALYASLSKTITSSPTTGENRRIVCYLCSG